MNLPKDVTLADLADYDKQAEAANISNQPPTLTEASRFPEASANIRPNNNNYIVIPFEEVLAITQLHSIKQGAILVSVVVPEDWEYPDADKFIEREFWLPKKLCSNILYTSPNSKCGSVQVWNKFLRDTQPELADFLEFQSDE